MGLFRKEYGYDSSVPASPGNDELRFNELKRKYATAMQIIEHDPGVELKTIRVQDGKLYVKGTAASEQLKTRIWDAIKRVDPQYADVELDLTVDPGAKDHSSAVGGKSYTVQQGDTLMQLAERFYGSANEYVTIFNANRDQVSDPNVLQPGQVLTIPPH